MGLFKAIGGVVGGFAKKAAAKRNQRRYAADRKKATAEMASLEKGRQKVINPYDNFANLSSMAKDLSGNLSNPYASLSVSTAAAEMQIEEADIALANTLDTLRATGAGAGGATALAQAALQSKKGVSASIEQQEVANEKMRAGGEERLQAAQTREQVRVQNVNIQEGRRMQTADAQGRTFKFNAQERRDVSKMNYLRQTYKAAKQGEYGSSMQKANAIGDIATSLGAVGDALGGDIGKSLTGGGGGGGGLPSSSIDFVGGGRAALDQGLNNLIKSSMSDIRLKENIKLIGKSPSGLNIYLFEYINKKFGKGTYQGVMSNEVPQEAVSKSVEGYDMVDYSKLDVVFKQI
jgi:hypothetical protein